MSQGPALASVLVAAMATADRSVDFEGMFEIVGLLERMEVDGVQRESSFGLPSCFYISKTAYRSLHPGVFCLCRVQVVGEKSHGRLSQMQLRGLD